MSAIRSVILNCKKSLFHVLNIPLAVLLSVLENFLFSSEIISFQNNLHSGRLFLVCSANLTSK